MKPEVIKFEELTVIRNHEFFNSYQSLIEENDQFIIYDNCSFTNFGFSYNPNSIFKGCSLYNCSILISKERIHIPENIKGYLAVRDIKRDIQDHVRFFNCLFRAVIIRSEIPLSRATFGLEGLEPIGTYKKIANKIKKNRLNMNHWHICDTCHCIAGWAQHIFDHGDIMQQLYGTCIAGTMIAPRVAHYFFDYKLSEKEAISALNEAEKSLMKDYEQITNNE